ncbi:3'-5' exonuclease [Aestuariibacter salexigens]|uniref:3'-5' exonuclease n=1 Tax=Aestuariibacter salexigens TaxID=226010 RepID=UPI0003FBE5C2|nr:3'-5' exonuclease [Aestuariibacter salexigens]
MSLLSRIQQWLNPASAIPVQWQDIKIKELPLIGIDLELTSLDISTSNITSIGWVKGQGNCLDLASCHYSVICTTESLNQSPVIHGLTAETIALGEDVKDALQMLIQEAHNHVWVLHNVTLDMGVLFRLIRQFGLTMPPVVTIDTLKLAVYQLQKQHQMMPPNSATLTVCRQRHDLPLAPAHNALDDAVATLELLFAQLYQLDAKGQITLADLMHSGAINVHQLNS